MPASTTPSFGTNRHPDRPGWVAHALLLTGICLVVLVFYVSWFEQGGQQLSVGAAYGREVVGVALQFYVLVWLFRRFSSHWWLLLAGLLGYYWLTYTYYFISAQVVHQYTGLDDFSGAAYYFIERKGQYWSTLFSYWTLVRLVRFPILVTIFPLVLWAGWEAYRRQVRNAQLQQQNTQLELDYLKSQVNPHFLFNILNSIYSITEEESPRAAQMVAQLSGLMRYALYETTEPLVPLRNELAFIRDYVSLEQVRTAKRLTLDLNLPDAVPDSLHIAPFILITFVENAFKHGVAASARNSWVRLSVQLTDDTLHLHIANSKPQKTPSLERAGVGLSNVQKRLALLYPNRHTLRIDNQSDSYVVKLTMQLGAWPITGIP